MPVGRLILAYDTERYFPGPNGEPTCVAALPSIVEIHRQHNVPGTFFLVGKLLEDPGRRSFLTEQLSDGLFAIGSHTYDHTPVRPHPLRPGEIPSQDTRRKQVYFSKTIIEEAFDREIYGFRSAWGFPDGLRGDHELLHMLASGGYKWSSSQLWGPDCTLPAPLAEPYRYQKEGFPRILEFPGHSWHDNVLKGYSRLTTDGNVVRTAWPSPYPDYVVPSEIITTPAEEFRINKWFIDTGCELGLPYVSFVWHPWSLFRFDPEMIMLTEIISYAQCLGMEFTTFDQEYERMMSEQPI